MRSFRLCVQVMLLLLLTTGCNIQSYQGFRMGVPFRMQPQGSLDCGPASVQMWIAYDQLPEPSLQEIGQYMGGTSCGVSEQAIADAVNHFTNTHDAYWDFEAYTDYEGFMSRQITSVDNYTPVIPIIVFNHAVVLNGGDWHPLSGLAYQWDFVYYHDPEVGPNVKRGTYQWRDMNCPPGGVCEQIISSVASAAWASNLANYSETIYDSSGCGSGSCSEENQY